MVKLNQTSEADSQLMEKLVELTLALSAYDQMNSAQPQSQQPWINLGSSNPWSDTGNLFPTNSTLLSSTIDFPNLSDFFQPISSSSSRTTATTSSIPSSPSSSSLDIDSIIRALVPDQQDVANTSNNNNTYQPNFQQSIERSQESSFLAPPSTAPTSTRAISRSGSSERNTENHYIEQVQVQSSAHVSYIVGKQGTKIRQIRTETETHIKTPVNGEEPIFEITGRKKNVQEAKQRILIEAHNFSMSLYNRARNYKEGDRRMMNLYLPSRYIGLVVGKKGASIKRIMDMSGATIVTPKVNTINIFELYGTVPQIRKAVDLIKMHIMSNNEVSITEHSNLFEVTLLITPK